MNTLDVGSKSDYPAGNLSIDSSFKFTIDGVECESMECFLQSLKFDKVHIQSEICKLSSIKAKHRGKERNNVWKLKQNLWWNGITYLRKDVEYQRLLDRAFLELARQNEKFCQSLIDSKDLIITNLSGKSNESETIITQKEFCSRLMKIRKIIRNGINLNQITKLS